MGKLEEGIGKEKFSSNDENFLPNDEVLNSVENVLSIDEKFEKIPEEDLKLFYGIYKQNGKGENYKAKTLAWLSVKSSFEGVSLGIYYPLVIEQLWWKNFDRESILLIGDIFFHSTDTWETFLVIRDLVDLEFSDVNFKEVLKQIREYHPRNVLINFLRREFDINTKREAQRYRIRLLLQSPTKFYENILSRFLRWSDKEIYVWKNDEDFFFKNIESVTDVDRKKNIEIVNQYQFELLEKNEITSSDRKLILYCRTDQWGQSAEYFYLVLRQLQNYIKNNSKLFNVIEIVSRGAAGNLLTDEDGLDDYRRQLYGLGDDVKHHDGVSGENFEKLAIGGNFLHLSHGVPAGIKYKSVDILPQQIVEDERKIAETTKDFFVEINKVDDISKVPSFKKFKKDIRNIINAIRACEEKEIANAKKYFAEKNKAKN